MNGINGISLYSLKSGIVKKEIRKEIGGEQQVEVKEEKKEQNTKTIEAKDILSYMAQQSLTARVEIRPAIDKSNFADTEQYSRISNIMQDFEAQMSAGLQAIDEDFSSLNLSDKSKVKIMLKAIEKNM